MFCHLFRLSERTGIVLHELENCDSKCSHFKDKHNCSMCEQKMENLTKEKYNWVLETVVKFDPPKESKSGNTRYLSAMSLIHPSHNDMWIIYSLRHNKVDDLWEPEFRLYFGGEMKDFLNLKALNTYLKKNGYPGRKIELSDFNINEIKET